MGQPHDSQAVPEVSGDRARALVASWVRPMGYEVTAEHFPGLTHFGGVRLSSADTVKYQGVGTRRVVRNFEHVAADHIDDYLLSLPVEANAEFIQGDVPAIAKPGSFVILSTSRPFDCIVSAAHRDEKFTCLHVRVDGSSLRSRLPFIEECCGREIEIHAGSGRIMRSLIDLALSDAGALPDSQGHQFSDMLVDAIANVAFEAHRIGSAGRAVPQTSHRRIYEQARLFIESNLANPELGLATVAEHCRVPSRYLRSVFASFSKTVDSQIRELRLQRCRKAIRSPIWTSMSIFRIAVSWGFNDAAHFSRLYKARFGRSPSDDRATSADDHP